MARQKQTAKPKADETVAADAEKETAKNAEATGETVDRATAVPEQASATKPEPATVTAASDDESKAQPDATPEPPAAQQTVTPKLRRFVVLKPVRFEGKRIPRAGRVTVTRVGHDELASLGAVSSVWDHGTPVETE